MTNDAETAKTEPQRMLSVDVLRGFDMFWLIGGTGLALGILPFLGSRAEAFLRPQLDHRAWEGCTFYDVIFPLFVFVVGMSVVFSLEKIKETQRASVVYKRILRRFVLMFALGLIYYGALSEPWPNIRLLGVLQRLALCYLFTAILYYHLRLPALVAVCAGLLIGYWALFTFVPVPGAGIVSCTEDVNWARYIDERFLPGRKLGGTWDVNGLLSTLPAIATCLMGLFAALFIKNPSMPAAKKSAWLIGAGIAISILGWIWGLQFPVIKKLWTSSYVLVTGGYCLTLLGAFYLVIDVWHFERWTLPFRWIGANPLAIYMARNLADFNAMADRITGGNIKAALGHDAGYLLQMIVSLALSLVLLRALYRRGIYLRV